MAIPVLSVNSLAKSFGPKRALRDLSLTVDPGQVFGILGPNGSGKTTTLGIALGAVRADAGRCSWFGQGASARERRRLGVLLEQPSFYPWLSGTANLRVVATIKSVSSAAADDAIRMVGLWDARDRAFETYSLGMKQRLAIATALMGRPEALVLDEPTNGVDAQGIFDIRKIIGDFARAGGTVILASHMLDEVEKVCTHVAILKDGTALRIGAISSVLASAGWLELGAPDLDGLAGALKELDSGAHVERQSSLILLRGSSMTPGEVNSRLAARGLFVSHLVRRQPSLESQYLSVVGEVSSTAERP